MSNRLDPKNWLPSYGDFLFSFAMLKTGDRMIAEDLVQETFLSAIKAKDSFQGNSSEKTWLAAILKNKIIDHYRKKEILKQADTYLSSTNDSFHAAFFSNNEDNWGHWNKETAPSEWSAQSADAIVNSKEFYKILLYCIEKMPAKLAPVFLARFIDEDDAENICKEFNLSSSNYWVIIHRAKVLVRNCLEKNWFLKTQ